MKSLQKSRGFPDCALSGNLDLAVDDYLSHNINYLRVILGVKLPPLD